MPITDLPTNPFWWIFTGSHQIAFVLAIVLLVGSVYYTSKSSYIIHAVALGVMAAISGLLSYGLLVVADGTSNGSVLLAVVLSSILSLATLVFVYVFARKVHWAAVFGLSVVSTMSLGFALEMALEERTVALAASNLMLWFATAFLLSAGLAKIWPSKKAKIQSSPGKTASFDQPLEASPN